MAGAIAVPGSLCQDSSVTELGRDPLTSEVSPLGGIGWPPAPPARGVRPVAPVTPVQERPQDRPTPPRYAPYGPDRPQGRAARAVHAYESTARLTPAEGPVLAGLDCYA